jgi:hypothetical protein
VTSLIGRREGVGELRERERVESVASREVEAAAML